MSTSPDSSGAHRVLVIESDQAARDELARLLATSGYCVYRTQSDQDALQHLRSASPPRLIVLDSAMPIRDASELRRHQRSDPTLAKIPVVLVSSAADLPAQAAVLQATAYLQKPIDSQALLAAVRRFMGGRALEVLVVEDEIAVLQMLHVALRHHGVSVRQAPNGKDALALYRQHQDTIDVVLLDVLLRGDWDGPQTLTALRAVNPAVRVCFMSGSTGRYTAQQLLDLGAARILPKPFQNLNELVRTLREVADDPVGHG